MKILLIEDSASQVLFWESVLARQGHRVVSARTPAEAVARRAAFRPDLVILDLVLPGMSGMDLLGRLREFCDAEGSRVPVFVTSAVGREQLDGLGALRDRLGPFETFAKPEDTDELLARLAALGGPGGETLEAHP